MKLLVLILLFFCFSCGNEENTSDCINANYGEVFELKEGQKACFSDGNTIELAQIKNEFCPCNVICFWPGEMGFNLKINDNENLIRYGHTSFSLNPEIFGNHTIQSLSFRYDGVLDKMPECDYKFNSKKASMLMMIK